MQPRLTMRTLSAERNPADNTAASAANNTPGTTHVKCSAPRACSRQRSGAIVIS